MGSNFGCAAPHALPSEISRDPCSGERFEVIAHAPEQHRLLRGRLHPVSEYHCTDACTMTVRGEASGSSTVLLFHDCVCSFPIEKRWHSKRLLRSSNTCCEHAALAQILFWRLRWEGRR